MGRASRGQPAPIQVCPLLGPLSPLWDGIDRCWSWGLNSHLNLVDLAIIQNLNTGLKFTHEKSTWHASVRTEFRPQNPTEKLDMVACLWCRDVVVRWEERQAPEPHGPARPAVRSSQQQSRDPASNKVTGGLTVWVILWPPHTCRGRCTHPRSSCTQALQKDVHLKVY